MTYNKEVRTKFSKLRRAGRSLGEISKELGISKSTASLWSRSVKITKQGKQRLNRISLKGSQKAGAITAEKRRKLQQNQEFSGFHSGLCSNPTLRDALCIGLYWGDGARSSGRWKFSNTDRDAVMEMIAWAIRSGHDSGFAATINAYDDSEYSDEEIEEFWKKCGISRVTVIRLESKCDPKKIGKHPFGTCHVRAVKSPRWLYSYYLGQRDALVYTENE